MADLKTVEGDALKQAIKDGYTPIYSWMVEYDDRQVEIPSSRYADVIAAERHFKAAYKDISERDEVISWLFWKRLARHEDANERPVGTYDEWLGTVVQPIAVCQIDLEEDAVPLVETPNPPDGN